MDDRIQCPRFGGTLPVPIIPTTRGLSLLPDRPRKSQRSPHSRQRDYSGPGWLLYPLVGKRRLVRHPEGSPQDWCNGVGNWFSDPKRFPNGMRPKLSQRAMDHGMKSVLWSEPERVFIPGTELFEKVPGLAHPPPDPGSSMSASSSTSVNADAWAWSVERFDSIISNQAAQGHQLDVFRQDFNMDPLDLLERQGHLRAAPV